MFLDCSNSFCCWCIMDFSSCNFWSWAQSAFLRCCQCSKVQIFCLIVVSPHCLDYLECLFWLSARWFITKVIPLHWKRFVQRELSWDLTQPCEARFNHILRSSSCYMMETTGSRCWANLYPVLTHQREPTCSQIFVASIADTSVDAFPSHFHSASAPEMGHGGCIRKCFEVIPINVAPSGQNVQLQI